MRRLDAGGTLTILTDRSAVAADLQAWARMVAVEVTGVEEGPGGWAVRLRRGPGSRLGGRGLDGDRVAGIRLF
ncbi:protein of unknown function [Candidatus Hydrogenisulfobacillus filiaventi]|uniref:Uncharacterized protein n=1 Tax=Candidatus Hydrogenisulfobacillus filiaventi TaxID=2707344 RepID=A0A6F8ZDI5_9FIRM|nr:protein of unknown function [Candidatus Hydrogenisulfobacillus filiaventi]